MTNVYSALVLTAVLVCACAQRVSLNYSSTRCNNANNTVQYGLRYKGRCQNFNVTLFYTTDILNPNAAPQGIHLLTTTNTTIKIPVEDLRGDETYVQILPVNEEGEACCDSISHQTYYRFSRPGGNCPSFEEIVHEQTLNNLTISIPEESRCGNYPAYFVWPRFMDSYEQYCYCLLFRNEIYSFDACAKQCESDYNVQMVDEESIVFHNFTSSPDGLLTHFLCQTDPCFQSSCIMNSLMATKMVSYQVNTATIPYLSMSIMAIALFLYYHTSPY